VEIFLNNKLLFVLGFTEPGYMIKKQYQPKYDPGTLSFGLWLREEKNVSSGIHVSLNQSLNCLASGS
jgi:hypothetical protein